ncbi:MAG TPA: M24 family metallopeptidase [Candidatus Binatia bacterium]|nr:M24 family metallopeptidase [Candidatus Binatia bacterium]
MLCAGCGYVDRVFPPTRPPHQAKTGEPPCAWLPDETAQWQLRRSAVNDKVRRLVVPALRAAELDAWLLVERAHQHDPMFDSLGITEPGDKAVLFIDGGGDQPRAFGFGSSPATLAQLTASGVFEQVQSISRDAVADTLARFRPQRVGIDYSARVPVADGITTGTRQFAAWLVGRDYAGTFRSAEAAAVTFRASHTPDEVDLARQAARCGAELAERVLTSGAIQPGTTTDVDVASQVLAAIHLARLDVSAPPHVSLVKLDNADHLTWPWLGPNRGAVIEAGDLLHLDFDLRYAGMAATVQRSAYVLKRWESEPPADLRRAFATIAQVRNGLAPLLRPGIAGRQLATDALAWAQQNQVTIELDSSPAGNLPRDVGTLPVTDGYVGPYDQVGVLGERTLQAHDLQSLAFRLTIRLDNRRQLTLAASDDGVVGFGGLEFLVPPADAPALVP